MKHNHISPLAMFMMAQSLRAVKDAFGQDGTDPCRALAVALGVDEGADHHKVLECGWHAAQTHPSLTIARQTPSPLACRIWHMSTKCATHQEAKLRTPSPSIVKVDAPKEKKKNEFPYEWPEVHLVALEQLGVEGLPASSDPASWIVVPVWDEVVSASKLYPACGSERRVFVHMMTPEGWGRLDEHILQSAVQMGWGWSCGPQDPEDIFQHYLQSKPWWRFWLTHGCSTQWVGPWCDVVCGMIVQYLGGKSTRSWLMDQRLKCAWQKSEEDAFEHVQNIFGGRDLFHATLVKIARQTW